MNDYSQQIKRELETFQTSVQKLGVGIKSASSLWKDSKYSELSSEVSQIANLARSVLLTGDKSCEVIDKFFKIANEEY